MSVLFPLIETFAPLVPLTAYFIVKPAKSRWAPVLLVYFIIYMLAAGYANFGPGMEKDNIIIYVIITVFTFINFALLTGCFITSKNFRRINVFLIVFVIIFSFYNAIWIEGLKYYNSNTSSLSAIILIVYCLYYYWQQVREPKDLFINRQPSFWIITGILIYCGGNFFLFNNYNKLCLQALDYHNAGLKDQAKKLWSFAELIWIIADFFILVTNIFFAKAILCIRRK